MASFDLFAVPVAGQLIRIFSDVHYGDRSSQVRQIAQLAPLCAEADRVILNGDTLDTRPGPNPHHTNKCRAEVLAFAKASNSPLTFLTGNHDPDLSAQHWMEFADGQVFVVHGDVLFDNIVPWGRDARLIRRRILDLTGAHPDISGMPLEERLAIWRQVAVSIPQRHQSERNPFKYAARFFTDTVWPPTRFFKIIGAWRAEPLLAAQLARRQKPKAKFILLGHTHRPAIRQVPGGPIIINTGSFTAPFGGYAVDLSHHLLRVHRIENRRNEFRRGRVVAEFPLANP